MSLKNRGGFVKKFNLFKEIIVADKEELFEALKSDKIFGVRVDGAICYEPFGAHDVLIFSGSTEIKSSLEEALGKNYQIVEDEERVLIKAASNWQEIIGFNKARATYDDTTADGVDELGTQEMEVIGWHGYIPPWSCGAPVGAAGVAGAVSICCSLCAITRSCDWCFCSPSAAFRCCSCIFISASITVEPTF